MSEIERLSNEWLSAKEAENEAKNLRREIEDKLIQLLEVDTNKEGTVNSETENYKIKIVGRLDRKVDVVLLEQLAVDYGLVDHANILFRWKAEVDIKKWKETSKEITDPLVRAIETAPGRPSFTITPKEK